MNLNLCLIKESWSYSVILGIETHNELANHSEEKEGDAKVCHHRVFSSAN